MAACEVDCRSRFLKVGIIQPGTGIELVLNEATKRKSSATVLHPQRERACRARGEPKVSYSKVRKLDAIGMADGPRA